MKNKHVKLWGFYGLMLAVFAFLCYILFHKAEKFDTETVANIASQDSTLAPINMFLESLKHNIAEPVALILLQIIAILLVARIFGLLFSKIGQPTVIGEILAGIVLGPSLLGSIFPEAFNFLFAPDSLSNLYILSQIGLVLFMFIIGLELDLSSLKKNISHTFIISHSSIILPFFLGLVLAYFIYEEFATNHAPFLSFSLFIGIAMSITAFPVLARIIQEKGLTKTRLGTIAIASAANDDVTAWCLLAAVIAIAKTGSFVSSLYTIAIAVIYVCFMLFLVRPFLKRVGEIYANMEDMSKSIFAFFILVLISSAFITQYIGIHALFGAFLAGVIMPPFPKFRKILIDRIENISVTLFLPLFFVYTGLNTKIGLLNTPHLWAICGIIIFVAVAGKFLGGAISARLIGENTKNSLSIGVLMNTRGLMELVVLNIGFEMGILPPTIFVMLVIMALVTTFMTTPILSLIEKIFPDKEVEQEYQESQAQGIFKVLIAMGNPANNIPMLRTAKTTLDGVKKSLDITALHVLLGSDTSPLHEQQFAEEYVQQIQTESAALNTPLHVEYKVTNNIKGGIVQMANYHRFDFLLVGANISFDKKRNYVKIKWLNKLIYKMQGGAILYPGNLVKDKTSYFVENSHCSVGVFVNRDLKKITNTILFLNSENDLFLLRYARYLLKNSTEVNITVLDRYNVLSNNSISVPFDDLKKKYPTRINKEIKFSSGKLLKYSFMLISYHTWDMLADADSEMLDEIPSTLIINKKSSQDRIAFEDEEIAELS